MLKLHDVLLGGVGAAVLVRVDDADPIEVAALDAAREAIGPDAGPAVLDGDKLAAAQQVQDVGELPVIGAVVGPVDQLLRLGVVGRQIVFVAQFPTSDLRERR